MDAPQIGDLGRAPKLGSRCVHETSKDRGHRNVDPDVDRTELVLDDNGAAPDLLKVRDIGLYHDRSATETAHLLRHHVEGGDLARDQPHRHTAPSASMGNRTPHAGRRAGNHGNARGIELPPHETVCSLSAGPETP